MLMPSRWIHQLWQQSSFQRTLTASIWTLSIRDVEQIIRSNMNVWLQSSQVCFTIHIWAKVCHQFGFEHFGQSNSKLSIFQIFVVSFFDLKLTTSLRWTRTTIICEQFYHHKSWITNRTLECSKFEVSLPFPTDIVIKVIVW